MGVRCVDVVVVDVVVVTVVQADRGPRQPVPAQHQHEAARIGRAHLDGEARDLARARLLRQPLRLLPRRSRQPADAARRTRQAGPQRKVSVALVPPFTGRCQN